MEDRDRFEMEGELLKFITEAFLVLGMDMPILLGEDFQINHKLTVKCSQEEGTSIIVGNSGHVVEGQSLERLDQLQRGRLAEYQKDAAIIAIDKWLGTDYGRNIGKGKRRGCTNAQL